MQAFGLIMFLFYSILGVQVTPSINGAEPAPEPYAYEKPAVINAPDENTSAKEVLDANNLAQCLTRSGAKLYTAYWCGHCQNQKAMFGEDLKYLTFVECDPGGENPDPEACRAAGIRAFPTWVLGDGAQLVGTQQLQTLAAQTAC